jgi:hypothetical protein
MIHGHLKLSTQVTITVLLVDSSDHITGKTGLAAGLTITASKAGSYSSTPITPTVAELDATNAKGLYSLVLTTTHTNTLGELLLHITASGADPADYWFQISTYIPGEAATLQSDQAVNATKFAGQTITAAAGVTLPSSVASPTNITAATGVVLSAAGVQAIWDALSSALTTVGSIGKRLVDDLTGDIYARLGSPAGASVSADIAAVKTDTAAVKVQTDKLTFTVSNQVDSNVLDWKSSTAPAMTGDAYARLGAPAGASVSADIAAVKVVDDAIKAKTDNLPSDPADASDIATSFGTVNTTLGTIAGYIDTEVAAIKAKTDNLPAAPAAVGDIPTADQNADALLDRSDAIETGLTPRGSFRLAMAALAGKLSGNGTTTVTIRNVGDTKDRITATIDGSKNRTAVSTDVS